MLAANKLKLAIVGKSLYNVKLVYRLISFVGDLLGDVEFTNAII